MSKKSLKNPDYSDSWAQSRQDYFLEWAYKTYCQERGDPIRAARPYWAEWYDSRMVEPSKKPYYPLLGYLYKHGCDEGYLRISYGEFVAAVTNHSHPYPSSRRSHYSRRRREYISDDSPYTDFWKAEYRHKLKYQKKAHHGKKVVSEEDQNHTDWREKKGFDKHKANPYWSTGKKWAKEISNSKHRAWERNNIKTKNWEAFDDYGNEILTWFFDPWMWD